MHPVVNDQSGGEKHVPFPGLWPSDGQDSVNSVATLDAYFLGMALGRVSVTDYGK